MIFKIFSTKRNDATETDDTGTYADGLFPHSRIGHSTKQKDQYRSSHERDYGADRKVAEMPVGFA